MKNFTIIGIPGTALSSATEVAMPVFQGANVSRLAKQYVELLASTLRGRGSASSAAVVSVEAARPTFVPVTADLPTKQVRGPLSSPHERST